MARMHRNQEDSMQPESNKGEMAKDGAADAGAPSATARIHQWPSPPENDTDGAAAASPSRAAGTTPGSPPLPVTQQRGLTRIEGASWTYTLREEIGRGAYGRVYLADATPHQPQPQPPQQQPPSASLLPPSTGEVVAGLGSKGRSGPRNLGGRAGRMVLKRMDNASVEDGLQAATLREIMVLDEVSAGTASRDRVERDAFRCGRAAFRPNATAPSSIHGQESAFSSFIGHSRYLSSATAEEDCDDVPLTPSATLRSGVADALSVQQRRRISRGRQHLIGMRDTIMRPHEKLAYVAMDYCEGGDLWHFLRDLKVSVRTLSGKFGDIMPTRVFRRWAVELILALGFLHSHNIAHRDLKPQNLMLAKRTDAMTLSSSSAAGSTNGSEPRDIEGAPAGELYTLKVGDFGLSRLEGIPYKKYVHEAVTLWYRSPDVLLGNTNYAYSADAWSLGCILVEMASGSVLFKGKDEADELKHIFTRGCRPSPSTFPRMRDYHYCERYVEVLNRYQESDAENMTAEELLQMQVERLSRHLRAFLRDRHALEQLGDAGVDLVARLLVLDPERRLTILEAMNHRFFTAAYAEVYGAD
ncbi:hypothetical protein LSCM1_04503 [Leishmania martiniquensis]|uniref:Protein kinase domain-containing protein n=1 Tax=Leishmania martiniquensis TaxID=1580590 RepID=A0A836H274_9TRYP|nr:hypothetical protein LSCM1_04503 [Leishmania martiniquensis]